MKNTLCFYNHLLWNNLCVFIYSTCVYTVLYEYEHTGFCLYPCLWLCILYVWVCLHLCVCLHHDWLPGWPFSLQLWQFPLRHNKGAYFLIRDLSPSISLLLLLLFTAAFSSNIHQHHQRLGRLLPRSPRISFTLHLSLSLSPYLFHDLISLHLCLSFYPFGVFVLIFLCLNFSITLSILYYKYGNETLHKQLLWGCRHTVCTHTKVLIYSAKGFLSLQSQLSAWVFNLPALCLRNCFYLLVFKLDISWP